MASFQEGHTTNLGKTYQAAKVKRIMKRRSLEAEQIALAALMPADLLPEIIVNKPKNPNAGKHPNSLAALGNRSGIKYPGAGRKKNTGSIKEKIKSELTKKNQADGLFIARRLINMAKAGDIKAIEIIMERMDGKVPQALSGDKDNPLIIQVEPILAQKYTNKQLPPANG